MRPDELKTRLVTAHRNEDWAEAARLSAIKAKQKSRRGVCEVCGNKVKRNARFCLMHAIAKRCRLRLQTAAACFLLCLPAFAGETFSWDAPTSTVDGFFLYASTNAFPGSAAPENYLARLDCGNETAVSIDLLIPGTLYFTVTSYADSTNTVYGTNYTSRIESAIANTVILRVPGPPTNMATLAVQWIGTLASTNWQDVGFFRLKIGP